MNGLCLILGMAIVTLAVKATVFILGERVAMPPWLEQALAFVPVTVLTAISTPLILSPHGQSLELSWHNPQLMASIVAIALCALTRRQLPTILAGLAVFFAWQIWIH